MPRNGHYKLATHIDKSNFKYIDFEDCSIELADINNVVYAKVKNIAEMLYLDITTFRIHVNNSMVNTLYIHSKAFGKKGKEYTRPCLFVNLKDLNKVTEHIRHVEGERIKNNKEFFKRVYELQRLGGE